MEAVVRKAFAGMGAAFCTPAALSRKMGVGEQKAFDVIADMESSGLVESEEADGGLVLTLTPRGAARLGLRLGAAGWEEVDGPWSPHQADGEEGADTSPYPTVMLSGFLWDNVPRSRCQVCGNRVLREHEYCIGCDRWGREPHEARRRDEQRRRRAVAP